MIRSVTILFDAQISMTIWPVWPRQINYVANITVLYILNHNMLYNNYRIFNTLMSNTLTHQIIKTTYINIKTPI